MGFFNNRATRGGNIFTSILGTLANEGDNIIGTPDNIARGKYPGATPFGSFGVRTTAGAEINVPIWPNGPTYNLPPATGVQMSIVSTSVNDTAAGTHVQQTELHYLDINLDPQNEIVIMNGLTPVLTVATDIRFIQCMHIKEVGAQATAFADGKITASNTAISYSEIAAGDVRCSSAFRMVPNGKRLYVRGAVGSSISGTAAARAQLSLVASELDNHQYLDPLILIPQTAIGVQDTAISANLAVPLAFTAGTVVGAIHTTDKAATISVSWFGTLEPVTA